MLRIIKRTWIRTLVAFDVRDPLKRSGKPYLLPEGFSELQPEAKLRATICNLFGNLEEPIDDIARIYDLTPKQIISILISEGLIKDQRRNPTDAVKRGRRSTDRSTE